MEYQRADRVGDLLIELISELIRKEIRDPRISKVTLTGAKVSRDLRQARIYFTSFGENTDKEQLAAGLKRASGFIRSKIAKQLNLRFVPRIDFLYDASQDEAQRIENLLKKVKE